MKNCGFPRRGFADIAARMGRVPVLLMLVLAPAWVHAAIAVEAAGTNAIGAPASSLTMTFTTGPSSNSILLVEAGTSAGSGGAYDTVSSVTAGGTALTKLAGQEILQSNYDDVELWYLVNPKASSSTNVVVNFSESHGCAATCVELSGVNVSAPWGAVGTKAATTSPQALTITTQYANSWVISSFQITNPNTPNLDSRYTTLNLASNTGDNLYNSMTYLAAGAPGNYNSYITWSGTNSGAEQVLAELIEANYPTATPTVTATPKNTGTPTVSPTFTRSPTVTPTPSLTEPGGGYPTATPTATPTTPPLPTVYSGLPTNMELYGMEYVPFPTMTTSSGNQFYPLYMTYSAGTGTITGMTHPTVWGAPCNTARWRIVFQGLSATVGAVSGANPQDLTISVETRIGANGIACNTGVYDANYYSSATSLSLPIRPQNNSTAYFWVGVSSTVVPYTERFDAVGDPRYVPYVDELDYTGAVDDGLQGGYNWFFRNFGDGSSTYIDGAQDAYYKPFIPSAQFDHYNGQQNIDIPKLFGLIRQGVMVSNAIYTAMTGWDSYYAGQGGEIGGDNSNDFGASGSNGVPTWGGPWGSSNNAYNVDEIIGGAGPSPADNGAAYVVTGTSSSNISWMSLPFVGELWPDGLYVSNWSSGKSASNGGNTTWGNLTNIESTSNGIAGVAYRLDQQDIPSSSSSYYQQTLHRNAANGCATFQNGTNDGSTPFNHNSATETAPLDNDGTQMSTEYNFSLPSTFSVTREWGLTVGGNTPQEWNQNTDPLYDYEDNRTHMDVYSDASYTANAAAGGMGWGFYADANSEASSVNKSAAAIRTIDVANALSSQSVSGNPAGGWFIVNGLAPSTQSGINFVAQFAILSCLRTLADAGAPTSSADNNNTYTGAGAASGQTYRIPPVPLVDILHPTTSDPVAGLTTISIEWDVRDARWDGNQYDENYPCLDANIGPCTSSNLIPNPALEWHDPQALAFNVIYSMPNTVSPTAWYSALTGNIVPAGYSNSDVTGTAGNYMPGADAILPGGAYQTSVYQYTYPWTNVAAAEYKVQVECFRLPSISSLTSYPHYAYHQILIDTVP